MNGVEVARFRLGQATSMLDEARGYIETIHYFLESEKAREEAGEEAKAPEWFIPYVTPILEKIIPTIERDLVAKEAILDQLEARAARNRGNANYSVANANAVLPNINSRTSELFEKLKVCAHFVEMAATNDFDFSTYFSRDSLLEKVREGNHSEVSFILLDENVETSHRDFEFRESAIGEAIFNNDEGMAQILMADVRSQYDLEFFNEGSNAVYEVVHSFDDDTEALELLLSFPQITEIGLPVILSAVTHNKANSLRILLADPRFIPNNYLGNDINACIVVAVDNGFTESLKILLMDPRGDPTTLPQESLFVLACSSGDLPTLKVMRLKFDPSINQNIALRTAIEHGELEIVNDLLKDRRVIAAGLDNALIDAIKLAQGNPSNATFKEIVKALKSMCPSNSCSITVGGRRKTKRHRKTKRSPRKFR